MSQPEEKSHLRSGIFLIVSLTLFAILVLMIGSKDRLLKRKVGFVTRFPDALGLKEGDSVTYLGVRIGAVEDFKILDDGRVEIRYKVDADAARQFTGATRATIGMVGVLGDKKIDIMLGQRRGPVAPLEPGSEIKYDPGSSFEALASGAQDLLSQLQEVTVRLGGLLERIDKGQGAIPRLFNDDAYGKKLLGDVQGAAHSARVLLKQLESGRGALPRLMNDPEYGDRLLGNLDGAARGFRTLAERVEKGPGIANMLVSDPDAARDFKALIASLRDTADALSRSTGFLGKLIHDPVYGDKLARHLLSSVERLDSILTKIDKGEGTIGALVNDPAMYQDLQDLTGGLRASSFGRKAVRHYVAKGRDQRVPGASAPASAPGPESAPAPASAPASAPAGS